jgi:peptidoglycan/xylan/chitin deacetylase (PgdA/CDA1 family)
MKSILLTCDTEIGETPGDLIDPFETLIEGKAAGQKVGYSLINQIANKYGAVVTHFVDVFPSVNRGEDRYHQLCEQILNDGHQLGLHTHPAGFFDPQRKWMYQYSLEEQIRILTEGKERIFHWTGQEISDHRAGGYGADDRTLDALTRTGFQTDCSYFDGQPKCKIISGEINIPFHRFGVWEIPVTVCHTIGSRSLSKLDWRYSLSSRDILAAINLAPDGAVITIFLHSFNFLRLIYDPEKKKYESITVDHHLIEEYDSLLGAIEKDPECTFVSLRVFNPAESNRSFLSQIFSFTRIQKRLEQEYFRVVKQKILL